ncbi:hypothetical protein D3981_004920 [Escherichia coli]|nr:hypothetical protein [Escherichia coli]
MDSQELITKVTQTLQRDDGSQAKIVVQQGFGLGLTSSISVYVLHRKTDHDPWLLCSDKPHPDWRTMSVENYNRYGRSEMLRVVSPGEILKLTNAIGKPMGFFDQ